MKFFMKLEKTKYYKTDCKYETINNLCWFLTLQSGNFNITKILRNSINVEIDRSGTVDLSGNVTGVFGWYERFSDYCLSTIAS